MAIFTATFAAVAVTAAQDLFEITAPADRRVVIHDIRFGQYTDFGDAEAEILSVQVIRGYTVSGSGGSTSTKNNIQGHSGAPAAGSVVEANNTTVANTGTAAILVACAWNVAGEWSLRSDVLADKRLVLDNSQRLVCRITAPADSLTMNGTIVWEEIPQDAQ